VTPALHLSRLAIFKCSSHIISCYSDIFCVL
jgi:hypothetical protein